MRKLWFGAAMAATYFAAGAAAVGGAERWWPVFWPGAAAAVTGLAVQFFIVVRGVPWACLVVQRHSGRVHHLHWPRREIVTCRRSAGFRIGGVK